MPSSPPSLRRRRSGCSVVVLFLLRTNFIDGFPAIPRRCFKRMKFHVSTRHNFTIMKEDAPSPELGLVAMTNEDNTNPPLPPPRSAKNQSYVGNWIRNTILYYRRNRPPINVDDPTLLLYDVILLMNLSMSISFFVTHRLDYYYLPSALNEGALLSICWIIAGLTNGSFLSSAIDGHYDPRGGIDEYTNKGGPKGAAMLAISTFISTSSVRIVFALIFAVLEHRPVGSGGEELIPLEIPFGLLLMSTWRAFHSMNTPRI
jgi:hypothetical protein